MPDPGAGQGKTSKVLGTKALGCKLARAAWHIMTHTCDYDPKRLFGEGAIKPSQRPPAKPVA